MSAVVSAVSDVFEAVGDAVGDIAEGIGDVVETVVEEVVEPVVKAVGNTIEAAMDDPLGTIAKVATAIYAPYLLPVVNFGVSVANGASIEKALGNAALSYVGGQIGQGIGDYASEAFELGDAASNIVTAGAKGATSSTLRGENPLCGAIGSIANNLINTGANALYKCLSNTGGSSCEPSGGLPVTAGGAGDECAVGCASTTELGALPVVTPAQIGEGQENAVNVTGGGLNYDCCLLNEGTPSLSPVEVGTNVYDCCRLNDEVPSLPPVEVTASPYDCCLLNEGVEPIDCGCESKSPGFRLPSIRLSNIKFSKNNAQKTSAPKTSVVQTAGTVGGLGCGAIPWLDTRDSMLRNQIKFENPTPTTAGQTKVNDIYGRMDTCLAKEMQDRYGGVPQINLKPFDEPMSGLAHGGSFAGGGKAGTSSCVASCSFSYCYNQDANYMPKFVSCGPDVLTNSAASKRQPLTHKQLSHLQQRISAMGNMGGLAAGGLPKKYHDAMPKDHNPQFVTGMTGYYACGGGTGQSDDIPAMLHDGDYVMDADVVAALGDGSSKAGREVLDGFRSQVDHKETSKGQPVPAKIADGEYVFPAGFVSALGGGDNKAGAKILDGLREKLRAHKRSAPTSKIPPKAKSPLDYIKQAKG
jgi:hypothetical protein